MPKRVGPSAAVMPSFLAGGGVTGELLRSVDWSCTSVGPISGWPASLRTIVGTMLHSRHPMFLWWGPDLIQFYNDAYLPSFGAGKHPEAMGQRGAECWQEIWPIISPQIDDVMQRAKSSWNEDHLVPIFRNGRIEEVYWTYGYSPVFDESGAVGGTLVVCTETTARVIGERRLRTLRALVDGTVLAATPYAVLEVAARTLASEPEDVPFALLYASDATRQTPALVRSIGLGDHDSASVDASVRGRLADWSSTPLPQPVQPPIAVSASPWPEPVTQILVAGIVSSSALAVSGYVVFGLSPRLQFDPVYADYLRQLAEHIAQAQARIEALQLRAVLENERNNLFEQAPVAIALMTGPEHLFRLANPLYHQLVGRTALVGQTYLQAFPELRDTAIPGILDRVYRTGEPFATNEMLVPLDRGDGATTDYFFKFTLAPIRHAAGDVYGMMAVAVDITPQVSARQVLEKAQAEREALLGELEHASRAKDEFLAMLGHELRNPLAPMLTALQLMRLRGVQGAEKEQAVIERQVKHVVRLVDDLLDVSRITRGKIQLKVEPVRLTDTIARAIEIASPMIEQRRHRLAVDVPDGLVVDGDPSRLAQVVANVLTNAAKYTDPGGSIVIGAERRDQNARLSIRDNGVGIGPTMLSRVFDPFAQEYQHSDRSQGGLGLGLAIVKSLVAAHGGTVTLQSEGNQRGTECVILLPLSSTGGADAAKVEQRLLAATADGLRILIVDDNTDAAEMLADSLRALGHHVRVAYDGPQALEMATGDVPDAALLDLGLPVIDGYEVAARLRTQPGWSQVRMVALTGYGLPNDRERTQRAGFDLHLVKPIDVNELNVTLRSLAG